MGILDFLFGKKPGKPASVRPTSPAPPAPRQEARPAPSRAAECPQEKTDDAIYQEAFAKATSTITAPQAALQGLFVAYREVLFSGSPARDCEKVIAAYLSGTGWTWGEFNLWNEKFKLRQEWPQEWWLFDENDNEEDNPPCSVEDAALFLKMNDLKRLLKKSGVTIKPAPKNKKETMDVFTKNLTWALIKDDVLDLYNNYLESNRLTSEKIENEKYRFLSGTIGATFFNLQKYYFLKNSIEYQCNVFNDNSVSLRVFSCGCPVEERFAELFNKGKTKEIPPYFPGDRNCLG